MGKMTQRRTVSEWKNGARLTLVIKCFLVSRGILFLYILKLLL